MTPEEKIDRDKRERENEVLALLLLLLIGSGSTRGALWYATSAVRLGQDPTAAIAAVLMGSYALGLPGGTARLATILARADYRGYRRAELLVPGDRFLYQPGVDYRSTAAQALSQLLATLNRRVAVGLSQSGGGTAAALAAIVTAFRSGGYTNAGKGPWALERAAVATVGMAYGTGQWNGYRRPGIDVRGFRYSSVLDNKTTEICHAYHAVRLPIEHPWWLSHWPLNHFGCRAVVLPITHAFTATPDEDVPYTPPPQPGFGRAPFALFQQWTTAA